jgi:hypothetical protein
VVGIVERVTLNALRENDLAARVSFYENYGEFFCTWKLWDVYVRYQSTVSPWPQEQRVLLERASKAEGGFEALLVKVASERPLSESDRVLLACFRESYQQLRENIRTRAPLGWRASGESIEARQYRSFKALAEYVAVLLESGQQGPHRITDNILRESIENVLGATTREVKETW